MGSVEEIEADVVCIGGGACSLSAALTAGMALCRRVCCGRHDRGSLHHRYQWWIAEFRGQFRPYGGRKHPWVSGEVTIVQNLLNKTFDDI